MGEARQRKRSQNIVKPLEPGQSAAAVVARPLIRRSALWICIPLIVLNLAVYSPVRNFAFVSFDDPIYVKENPHIVDGLSWQGSGWALTTGYASNWHPLTWLSHMVDVQMFGLNPGPQHIINVTLHTANSLLLFGLLYTMTAAIVPSGFVAALFAVHPLHVESVAWISERKDVLSTLFLMLTIWAYAAYARESRKSRYLLVMFLFALGLMSKPMLVTLPFVLLLLDIWPLSRLPLDKLSASTVIALVREKVPLVTMAMASSVVTFVGQQRGGAVAGLDATPVTLRIANALASYVVYLAKMAWPTKLAALYPFPRVIPAWQTTASLMLLLIISIIVCRASRQHPYAFVGWFWYVGTLIPVIGLVQVGIQSRADRYTYVPFIGLFIILVWGVRDLVRAHQTRANAAAAAAMFLVLAFAIVARNQVEFWRNSLTLWKHTIETTSQNYRAQSALADEFWESKNANDAITHYLEALRIEPRYAEAHNKLGVALAAQGNLTQAIAHYREAVHFKPTLQEAHDNLGNAMASLGKLDEAVAHYNDALRLNPDDVQAHNGLGSVLDDQNKVNEAMAEYREALRVKPDFAEAHNNIAAALARANKFDDAIEEMLQALRIKPDDADFHYNLAMLLQHQGRMDEARNHFETALKLRPDHFSAGPGARN